MLNRASLDCKVGSCFQEYDYSIADMPSLISQKRWSLKRLLCFQTTSQIREPCWGSSHIIKLFSSTFEYAYFSLYSLDHRYYGRLIQHHQILAPKIWLTRSRSIRHKPLQSLGWHNMSQCIRSHLGFLVAPLHKKFLCLFIIILRKTLGAAKDEKIPRGMDCIIDLSKIRWLGRFIMRNI